MSTDIARDELDYGSMIDGLVPFQGSPEAEALVSKWTKYNKADEDVWNVKIDDGLDLVLVRRPDTGTLGVVCRCLEEQVPLGDGKTFNRYSIVGIKPVSSIEEGADLLRRIRSAYEIKVARDVEGFGNVVVDGRSVLTDAATGRPAEGPEVGGF